MKKIITAMIVLLAVLSLAACGSANTAPAESASSENAGQTEGPAENAPEQAENAGDFGELKTMGDVLGLESESNGASWNENYYVYVLDYKGKPLRITAEITPEIYEKIEDALFNTDDPDESDKKLLEALGDVPVTQIEDLSLNIPTQEEMDKLIGMTGQQILDDGYVNWSCWQEDGAVYCDMSKDDYQYVMTMEGDFDPDNFDGETAYLEMTVAAVSYNGVSTDAAVLPGE